MKSDDSKLTQELVKRVLDYSPETGVFTRRVRTSNRVKAGLPAGGVDGRGYWLICVGGERHTAHRLAFLYMEGSFPKDQVDHINGERSDNKWSNLRHATNKQNAQNKAVARKNRNGHTGVSWCNHSKKWRAYIKLDGKMIYLGYHKEEESAVMARRQAEVKPRFGPFKIDIEVYREEG